MDSAATVFFKRIFSAYAVDYFVTLVVLVLALSLALVEPRAQVFSPKDIQLQYPFTENETIPMGLCLLLFLALPIVIIISIGLFAKASIAPSGNGNNNRGGDTITSSSKLWLIHSALFGLLVSISVTAVFTEILKFMVGRPRPDILSRCMPDNNNNDAAIFTRSMLSIADCTQPSKHLLHEGFRSFPSGHASYSFSGLAFLACLIAGFTRVFLDRPSAWRIFASLGPMFLASIIAASRISDYRHHASDVAAGSIIGISVAIFVYNQYFNSLFDSVYAGVPLDPKSPIIAPPRNLLPLYNNDQRYSDSGINNDNNNSHDSGNTTSTDDISLHRTDSPNGVRD